MKIQPHKVLFLFTFFVLLFLSLSMLYFYVVVLLILSTYDVCYLFNLSCFSLTAYSVNSSRNKISPSRMAPTTTIETVTITRPLKVIAFICGVIVIALMIIGLTSTDWLMAESWRQGLFVHCIEEDFIPPLPFKWVFFVAHNLLIQFADN